MKKAAVFLCALCLTLALAPSASASQITGGTSGITAPQGNLTEMFAQMQMEMAASAKDAAMQGMDAVQQLQDQQKQTVQYLRQAQALQTQAEEAARTGQTPPALPQELKRYLEENGVPYTDIPSAVRGLQALQEQQAEEIQRQMVHVQDYLAQYNASTGDVRSYTGYGQSMLESTARGQSLFSTSGAAATEASPLVASLLAGVLLGMGAMWGIQRGGRKGGAQ